MNDQIDGHTEQLEEDRLLTAFAKLAEGDNPTAPEAQVLVAQWQAHMLRFRGSCDEEKLRRMGQLYSADDRFSETLDSYGDGTAHFMGEAILAYLEHK